MMNTKALNNNKLAAIDPICGLQIDPDAKSNLFVSIRGHTYHFYTEKCRNEFKKDPVKYMDISNTTKKRKLLWSRYLDWVQKATNGKPPKCCR
jgi:YHS domain-containing protein